MENLTGLLVALIIAWAREIIKVSSDTTHSAIKVKQLQLNDYGIPPIFMGVYCSM